MQGLMMDMPLLISGLIDYAATYHGDAEIVAREIEGDIHRYTYADAHPRIKKMALALQRLGIKPGDRVGTLAWNTHRHLEMFYAAPGVGIVLHTVNPRLFPDQLVYIINHAEDRLLFVDRITLPIVEAILPKLTSDRRHRGDGLARAHAGDQARQRDVLRGPDRRRGRRRLRLAELRRKIGLDDLLHLRHHRQSEGRGLFASRRGAADHGVFDISTSSPGIRKACAR